MIIAELEQRLYRNTSEHAAMQVRCVQLEEQVASHQQYQRLILDRAEQMAAAYKGEEMSEQGVW